MPFLHIETALNKEVADQLTRAIAKQASEKAPIHIQVENCSMDADVLSCRSDEGCYKVKCVVVGQEPSNADTCRTATLPDQLKRLPPVF